MSKLSEQNIDFITGIISNSRIESIEMKEDLIDHFCCAIEEDMDKGLSFEKSYKKAYQSICPNGLDEIQQETVYLLTSKKIKAMKRFTYVSGYLTAVCITTTFAMKLTHTKGGSIALLASSFFLMFLFLPSLFLNLYKREIVRSFSNKLLYMLGFVGILLLISSILFKLQHWGNVSIQLFSAVAIINFALFPLLFYKMYRKSEVK
ncbi:MAG TPA: hypothetical protein VHO46_09880 [Bacteroidales bacterium]|nr:hypothetical protein [Bacteroidales bacterium]